MAVGCAAQVSAGGCYKSGIHPTLGNHQRGISMSPRARDSLYCHSQRAAAAGKPRLKEHNLIKNPKKTPVLAEQSSFERVNVYLERSSSKKVNYSMVPLH